MTVRAWDSLEANKRGRVLVLRWEHMQFVIYVLSELINGTCPQKTELAWRDQPCGKEARRPQVEHPDERTLSCSGASCQGKEFGRTFLFLSRIASPDHDIRDPGQALTRVSRM